MIMNVKFHFRWHPQQTIRSALDFTFMVWPPSSLECAPMFEDPGKYTQIVDEKLNAVRSIQHVQTPLIHLTPGSAMHTV